MLFTVVLILTTCGLTGLVGLSVLFITVHFRGSDIRRYMIFRGAIKHSQLIGYSYSCTFLGARRMSRRYGGTHILDTRNYHAC
jgi:hypothetical protein